MQANKRKPFGTALAVQWLGLRVSAARSWEGTGGGTGLIPGQGTKMPLASLCGQKRKKERKKENPGAKVQQHLCTIFILSKALLISLRPICTIGVYF